ncbi:hypothetical protein INR49_027679 [Caranx melampygus]|nr:hypothetical protein INR49_027679 [Caranx melampygus]
MKSFTPLKMSNSVCRETHYRFHWQKCSFKFQVQYVAWYHRTVKLIDYDCAGSVTACSPAAVCALIAFQSTPSK